MNATELSALRESLLLQKSSILNKTNENHIISSNEDLFNMIADIDCLIVLIEFLVPFVDITHTEVVVFVESNQKTRKPTEPFGK